MQCLQDKQGKRIAELEGLVTGMNVICTKALDQEIQRLETKKKELIEELEKTEDSLELKKAEREKTKNSVQKVLLACAADRPKQVISKLKKNSSTGSPKFNQLTLRNRVDSDSPMGIPDDASDIIASTIDGNEDPLEEQYLEEIEMLAAVRETMSGSNLLFVLHRSNADDIIMYLPSDNPTEVVSISKLTDPSDKSTMGMLSSFDFILGLGSKIVPNHVRDLPDVQELPIPCTYEGSAPENALGTLIGAVEITLAQDVIIDIWKTVDSFYWATTSVNGVQFSVIERIFVTCDMHWGVPSVTQIDLFARHPSAGHLIIESISSLND